jgi:hypothetical protein
MVHALSRLPNQVEAVGVPDQTINVHLSPCIQSGYIMFLII